MNIKRNTEVDILYNLLTYINASYSQGIYYTICYQVLNNIEKIVKIRKLKRIFYMKCRIYNIYRKVFR